MATVGVKGLTGAIL